MSPTVVSALNRVRELRQEAQDLRIQGRHADADHIDARIEALMSDIARIADL